MVVLVMPTRLFHPRSFIAAITTQPEQLFWTFLAAHLVLWTLVSTLASPNAPLDVIEGYAWGREWLLGTYKHPPMQAWILQILAILTDRASWAHFLASQIAVVVAFWAVWQTGKPIVGATNALIAVLMLEGVVYYNFTSTEFNPNVLQLPFWALIGLSFYRAVKDNRLIDWLLLGLWSAGGLYAKYSTALLLLTLMWLMFAHRDARRRLAGVGPYLTVIVTMALFMPHILWLTHHDFLPLDYMLDRLKVLAPAPAPVTHRFFFSLFTLLYGQFIALLPLALLFPIFFTHKETANRQKPNSFDQIFLDTITFGPLLLTFILSMTVGFKMHDMWGTPFWNFIGLWAIVRFRPLLSPESLTRFVYTWSLIFLATLLIYLGVGIIYPYAESKTQRVHFPGRALSQYITDAWHQRYHTPLRYAIGDTWPAGNVAYYAPERPHVFILGDKTISPWIKLDDFRQSGGIVVWCVRHCLTAQETRDNVPAFVVDKFPQAEIQEPFFLARQTEADVPAVKMGWAIIPPQPNAP